ncbi:MAG: DUF5675 family protein [Sulfuricaulis sp.]
MKTLPLWRTYLPNGTRGYIEDTDNNIICHAIERAKDDPDHPCVPEGTYLCKLYQSPEHGRVFMLQDVPGRTYVEIHICEGLNGTLDYVRPAFLLGCVGLGMYECWEHGEPAVCASHEAFRRFMDYLQSDEAFYLRILELKGATT